ncbi:LON peptidase substrate-binding domain-containing protein [Ferrimonas marina]|uniref:Lon N-terminal domain-containing protein n=1 Tax=Ferrimonas marina TaxID=299255 RepID=A0A1M5VRB3_9GAMM|nr:LON peptidase substrate-binding domain-containing protein [Ferrimonas marina]SHH77767.1 hypothetical protein SAMN02745129_2936 [Ferrimonas marina]
MALFQALPLFPLPSQVFPGGKMPLRIFEPRYVRMVKESFASSEGFAICMLDDQGDVEHNTHIFPLATRVQIVDFNPLDDGMLGVTVEGLERLRIHSVRTEEDGLRVGRAEGLPNWPHQLLAEEQRMLAQQLAQIFKDYTELAGLYPEPHYDDASWVAQRWLELVPLTGRDKQRLWQQEGPEPTLKLINEMLTKE